MENMESSIPVTLQMDSIIQSSSVGAVDDEEEPFSFAVARSDLKSVVFNYLEAYRNDLSLVKLKQLREHCEKEFNLPKGYLKQPDNGDAFATETRSDDEDEGETRGSHTNIYKNMLEELAAEFKSTLDIQISRNALKTVVFAYLESLNDQSQLKLKQLREHCEKELQLPRYIRHM